MGAKDPRVDAGIERAKPAGRTAPRPPADLIAALRRRRGALAAYKALPPSHRREYVNWILEARKAETRARRIRTTVERIAEGGARHR